MERAGAGHPRAGVAGRGRASSVRAPGRGRVSRPRAAGRREPDTSAGGGGGRAAEHGLRQLDEEIAYLVGDHPVTSPWLTGYRVLELLPFSLKPLRAALRRRGVADVIVKKRGSAVEPQALRQRLLAGLPRTGASSV